MRREVELSVIVPLFNEADNIEPLYEELKSAVRELGLEYEILLVNDGSVDGTLEALRTVCKRDDRIKVLSLSRNFGQSSAIQAGFDHANGSLVVTLDGDLQNDPADIGRLLAKLSEGYDVVSGWRKKRVDRFLTRRIPSQAANWLIGRLTGIRVHDNGCTLKAYKREVVRKTRLYSEMHRFMMPLLSFSGCRYTEIEVHHRARRFGISKYGIGRLWKVFLDLLALKMLLRVTSRPAAWFTLLSLPFVGGTMAAAVASLFLYLGMDGADRFPIVLPSVVVLLAFVSAHLIVLGLAAELIVWFGEFRQTDVVLTEIEGR